MGDVTKMSISPPCWVPESRIKQNNKILRIRIDQGSLMFDVDTTRKCLASKEKRQCAVRGVTFTKEAFSGVTIENRPSGGGGIFKTTLIGG